jgi:inositol-pentakisphosphate 2-kinase
MWLVEPNWLWQVGRVLRIRKAPKNDKQVIETQNQVKKDAKPVLSEDERKLWREWPSMGMATTSAALAHVYAYEIMQPLLGKDHVYAFLKQRFLMINW